MALRPLVQRFRDLKLSRKMTVCFTAALLIFLAAALTALEWSSRVYDKTLCEKSLAELDFFSQRVDWSLEEQDQLTKRLALNSEIQSTLSLMAQVDYPSAAYSYHLQQLRTLVSGEMFSFPCANNVSFADRGRVQLSLGDDCGTIPERTLKTITAAFRQARGGYMFLAPSESYPYVLSGRSVLELKNVSLQDLGTFLVSTDLTQVIERQKQSLEAEHATLFILRNGRVLYAGAEDTFGVDFTKIGTDAGYRIIHQGTVRYFMCYMTSRNTQWTYVNIFPYAEVYRSSEMVRSTLLTAFLVLFLVLVLTVGRLSVSVTKPLKELTDSIVLLEDRQFQQAKDALSVTPRKDEVGTLSREYASLLEHIDELMYENYEKQLLLQDTKYRMLQAQINPHFLYNTLNTLNWMVLAKRNEDASKMIISLGKLLRATFGKESMTTVAEEVQTAEHYIVIQKYRYQSRAEFRVETQGNLAQYQMPNMILQPLIENALLHGVDTTMDFCTVTVRALERQEDIFLEVADTGGGMTPEELTAARNLTVKTKGRGIGLKNICERLQMTFGNYEFRIESQKGRGTSISISIPKRKAEDHV